jgi:hypothetical protein
MAIELFDKNEILLSQSMNDIGYLTFAISKLFCQLLCRFTDPFPSFMFFYWRTVFDIKPQGTYKDCGASADASAQI